MSRLASSVKPAENGNPADLADSRVWIELFTLPRKILQNAHKPQLFKQNSRWNFQNAHHDFPMDG